MPSGFCTLMIGNFKHERQGVIFMQEIWKDIPDYEGIYQVSNLGNIKSIKRIVNSISGGRIVNERILRQKLRSDGYLDVELSKNNVQKSIYVHRLVAIAFIDNPNNYDVVNHKDENKSNNCVNNLEWCNHKYNTNYGTAIKRRNQKIYKKVKKYDKNMNFICEYNSLKEASNGDKSLYAHIGDCCKGKIKSCGGYIWRYSNE